MTRQVVPTAADLAEVEEDRSVASLPTATDIDEIAQRIRCLNDQLLVKLEELPKMFGMLHIPDTARNTEQRWAKVIAIGPGAWSKNGRITPEIEPGDSVLLSPDPGWELSGGYRILRVGAVLAWKKAERD